MYRVIGFLIVAWFLAFGEFDFFARQFAVRDFTEKVVNDVEPGALLVIRNDHVPRSPGGVRGGEHLVACARVIVPAGVRLEVHRRKLPGLAAVVDPAFEAASLLLGTNIEPVLEQDDPGLDHGLFDQGDGVEKGAGLFLGAEAHDAFDARAVVPTAIKDDDLARGGEVGDVTLDVHLGFFTLGRRGKGDDAKDARADALCDSFNDAPLPAPSRPSKTTQTLSPFSLTQAWSFTSST